MNDVREAVLKELAEMGETPCLGGRVSEKAAAKLLMYTPEYFRQKAADGLSPIPWKRHGNRRYYRLEDIIEYLSEDDGV
ncbi:hypothetical protein [Alcanivorax sp.]|uniref:hypothetical protein n=1 Tax=Alcanivorax sp. TaxID=1872427 RepID=UPI0025C3576A|nr:hypothetical protein [Alcanivorax sp.]